MKTIREMEEARQAEADAVVINALLDSIRDIRAVMADVTDSGNVYDFSQILNDLVGQYVALTRG